MKTLIVKGKSRKLFLKSYICWIRYCLFVYIYFNCRIYTLRRAHPQMSVTDEKAACIPEHIVNIESVWS